MTGAAVALTAYLLGGIPFGYLFYRMSHGRDIRGVGSGNTGATNITRAAGWKLGLLTLILDAAKGAVAVEVGLALTGSMTWGSAAGMAAVAGHCFPVWLRFRGGKGVATGCGAFFMIHPVGMLLALGVFALTLAATRMVAAGSLVASVSFPVAASILGAGPAVALLSAGACLLIVVRHHENVGRMLRGEEGRMFGEDRRRAGQ